MKRLAVAASGLALLTVLSGCGDWYESDTPLIGSPGSSQVPSEGGSEISDQLFKFGQTAGLENGISLTVSAPQTTTVQFPINSNPVVSFRIKMTNGSKGLASPQEVLVNVSSGGEAAMESYERQPPTTQLLPGKSISWDAVWFVKDPKDIQLELSQPLGGGVIIFTS